jgi:hypothetical protein
MVSAQFQNRDARIVYLATIYHLGRPGSETDAITLEHHNRGLGPVRVALEPQLDNAVATLELSDYQLHRLGEALLGVVNELKQVELARGRSAVPGFTEALTRVFPDVDADDPGTALDLVGHAVMLRRRLDTAVRDASEAGRAAREEEQRAPDATRRPWWKVWQRG